MVKYRTRKDRTRVPGDETPRDKFFRLGERRVNRALTAIRLLGNLASSNYTWEPEDVKMIRAELARAMEATFAKFEIHKRKAPTHEFHFPSAQTAKARRSRTRRIQFQPAPQAV